MYFRKRIKITKGLHLNISGSGVGLSVGGRGASVSFGSRGTYLNTGIPGTGLYSRKRISSSNTDTYDYDEEEYYSSGQKAVSISSSIDVDKYGNVTIKTIRLDTNEEITDEATLRRIRKLPKIVEEIQRLREEEIKKYEEEQATFIDICKLTEHPITEESIIDALDDLSLEKCESCNSYDILPPSKEDIRKKLEIEAKNKISSVLFWTNSKKREKYVNDNLETRYNNEFLVWQTQKDIFLAREKKRIEEINAKYLEEYNQEKEELNSLLEGKEEFIEERLDKILSEFSLPIDIGIDYEYDSETKTITLELELPGIDNVPCEVAKLLATGEIKYKRKPIKNVNADYAKCICGIAFYLAGLSFNTSINIKTVKTNGFIVIPDPNTGKDIANYIYKVSFDRDTFASLNYKDIIPYIAFSTFPMEMKLSKQNVFSSIETKPID